MITVTFQFPGADPVKIKFDSETSFRFDLQRLVSEFADKVIAEGE
jgi:hypothetical protein